MAQGTLAQAIEILTAQGVRPQEYKHLKPDAIIKLAGLQP
ncbi:hypothetical protein L3i20_v237000 [Paenibacillus sp. L3-i20]|nr:hypothetical protein L3i20_v237000 [Paenibacillus sp. L3-i20]